VTAARLVVFGATGYTGQLTARHLVASGRRPVLAGRSARRLEVLADELGGVQTAVADVSRPESVRSLVSAGDVLLTTVGPFARWGDAAAQAAVGAGAHYVDSTGEPAFIRRVFDEFGPRAAAAGTAMLTACGFDWVPGNLAGALALSDAGPGVSRLDIGYFTRGHGGLSAGTRASMAGTLTDPSFGFRGGRLRAERMGARVVTFRLGDGRIRRGISVGGSEPYSLPGRSPSLRDLDVVVGQRGWWVPAVPMLTAGVAALGRLPLTAGVVRSVLGRGSVGATGGPDAAARAGSGCLILADAFDAHSQLICRVRLEGPNPYDFTARMLSFVATSLLDGPPSGVGALGPVDAFGLPALQAAAAQAGLVRVEPGR